MLCVDDKPLCAEQHVPHSELRPPQHVPQDQNRPQQPVPHGHGIALTAAERAHLEEKLEERRKKIKTRIELKEKELQELKRSSSAADAALRLSRNMFSQTIKLMREKRESMEHEVWSLLHGAQTGFHVHLELIYEDVEDLKEQIAHRESLLKTQDPYKFLLKHSSLLEIPEAPQKRRTSRHFLPLRKFTLDKSQVPLSITALSVIHKETPPPYMTIDYHGWEGTFRSITWDPNSAHRNVALLTAHNGKKWAIFKSQPQEYAEHPERFNHCVQVLSREPLTGRCFFEVCPRGDCFIGLAYRSIDRKGKGKQSILGLNDRSWACFGGGQIPQNTENGTWLLVTDMRTEKVAVFLDHRRGILRFYSGTMGRAGLTLLGEVQRKFTEPLYFGAAFVTPGDHVVIPRVDVGRDVVFIPTEI